MDLKNQKTNTLDDRLTDSRTAMKLLLFALGMGAGLILAAIVGLLASVLFSCLLIIAAIGVLLDNLFEEEQEDEDNEDYKVSLLKQVFETLVNVAKFSGSIWLIMLLVTFVYGYKFESSTWLWPVVYGLTMQGWNVITHHIYNISDILEDSLECKKDG